jgi:hypothetical protein
MVMPVENHYGIESYVNAKLLSSDGDDIGSISRFLVHRLTRLPTWIVVDRGFLARDLIVPVADCEFEDDGVVSPFSRARIEAQPEVDIGDDVLSAESETLMDDHFGLGAA